MSGDRHHVTMARKSLLDQTAGRVPGLKRIPVAKLLVIGELALLARTHVERLDPQERRRFLVLMGRARGRRRNMSDRERAEFAALTAKLEPRLFAGLVADRFSPVPLPRRVVEGKGKRPRRKA
jgi:hypothetical protein